MSERKRGVRFSQVSVGKSTITKITFKNLQGGEKLMGVLDTLPLL